MNRLFISYSYTASQNNIIYQGFENMICELIFHPASEEHVEELHNLTAGHCKEKLGMETAITTILFWKELNDKAASGQ